MSGPRILSAAVGASSQLLFLIVVSRRGGGCSSRRPAKKEERPRTLRERGPATKDEPSGVEQSRQRENDREADKETAKAERGREDRLYAGCTGGRGGPSSAGGLLSHLHTRSHIRSWVARHRRRPRTLRHQLRGKGRQTSPR